MAKFVRYTCNKKNVPVLRESCKQCSAYDPCAQNGKWCFVGALVAEHDPMCAESCSPILERAAAPVLRDMSTVTINLGNGLKVDVLREGMRKQLEHEFYRKSGLIFGA